MLECTNPAEHHPPTPTQRNQPLDLLTVRQVAQALHYSQGHVRRLVREGKITAEKPGRKYVITGEELDRYIAGGAKSTDERAQELAVAIAARASELTTDQRARLAALLG